MEDLDQHAGYVYQDVNHHRSRPDELLLLTIESKPSNDFDNAMKYGGAYVNCYFDLDDLVSAEKRAVAYLKEIGSFL